MLSVKTILHPTDFSEHSRAAFHMACALAGDYGARIVILHVIEVPVPVYRDGVVLSRPELEVEPLLDDLHQLLPKDSNISVDHRLVRGDPPTKILELARETACDFIVMGTHGRTGLGRLLMGSVAEQILRKAPCPVLTLKYYERASRSESKPETTATDVKEEVTAQAT